MFDALASGRPILSSLLMESGRLEIALENGLGSAFSSVATRALAFVNPVTLGIGAVAGLGAAAYLATSRVREMQMEMSRAVGGAGRFAGLSGDGLSRFAGQRGLYNAQQGVIASSSGLPDWSGNYASKMAAATSAQSDWNRVAADGVTQQKLINQFGSAGAQMWDRLSSSIGANAAAQGDLARQRQLVSTEDSFRSGFTDTGSELFSGLARGQPLHSLISRIGMGFGDKLIHSGMGMMTDGLFGKSGQSGGGLFGGLLGDLFSGHMFAKGTDDAPGGLAIVGEKGPELVRMPEHAQVIPNSALGGFRGGGNHTFNIGGPTINVAGDVSEQNRAEIQRAVAQGQRDTIDHITRNLGQIQSDAAQTGAF